MYNVAEFDGSLISAVVGTVVSGVVADGSAVDPAGVDWVVVTPGVVVAAGSDAVVWVTDSICVVVVLIVRQALRTRTGKIHKIMHNIFFIIASQIIFLSRPLAVMYANVDFISIIQ